MIDSTKTNGKKEHVPSNPATFDRTTFTQSRLLDFFTERSFSAETGLSATQWPLMIVKELVDNSLDACESKSIAPEITIEVDEDTITVRDNGPGIPVETIQKMLDYSTRTSSNSRIVSPTRGSQGNALKTLVAASYVVSDEDKGFVHISTNGVGFGVEIETDPIRQEPTITMGGADPICKNGTSIRVKYPSKFLEQQERQFLQIAHTYAFLNPHTSIKIQTPNRSTEYTCTNPQWDKWLTSTPTSALWYSRQDFESLAAAHIAHDGGEMTVREFVTMFHGFSGSAKNKRVLQESGLSGQRLSDFETEGALDHVSIGKLLNAMKKNSRPIKPRKLGVIGEDHMRQRLRKIGGDSDHFRYKCLHGTQDGIPYVVEAAFVYMPKLEYGLIMGGINWAASINRMPLQLGDRWSLDGLLEDCKAGTDEPIFILLHLATPTPGILKWLDRGKSRANLEGEVAEQVRSAIQNVTSEWTKRRKSEERNAHQAERRDEALRKKRKNKMSLKSAILKVLPDALKQVSSGGKYPFGDREFYYVTREMIQKRLSITKPLKQGWFDQVVNEYEARHGVIELRHRYPRGYLIEPHSGTTIPLGTSNALEYDPPEWRFHTVLFVEKKSYEGLFRQVKLAEKYDMAIILSEGYAVDAAKMILSKIQENQEVTILCLHDADPAGKNIARTLQNETLRSGSIRVVDIGLHLNECLEMGFTTEVFERKVALPQDLQLTDVERELWTGEFSHMSKGKRVYECQRVELCALAANPQKFLDYIERKIEENGCKRKLVPPDGVIDEYAKEEHEERLSNAVSTELKRQLKIGSKTEKLTKEMEWNADVIGMSRILDQWQKKLEPESWEDAINREIENRIKAVKSEITEAVKREIKK